MSGYTLYQLAIDPLTWDSIVAVALFPLAMSPGLFLWVWKKYRKRILFRPEYQCSQTSSAFCHDEIEASRENQNIQITLRMALETHVEFVVILFDGQGRLPIIKILYDWQWKGIPHYVNTYCLPDEPEGKCYWKFKVPEHRLRKSRITIGVEFLATDYFEGYIIVQMICLDGGKE